MNLLGLVAKLSLDKSTYEMGLEEAKSEASGLGDKIKGGLSVAAKATTAAVAAASGAVVKLTSDSVRGFADFQQNVGGVQKLYGNMGMSVEEYAASVGKSVDEVQEEYNTLEQAQNMVLENAKNAYRTSGMSANKYMETATSFSAALINSLDGDTVKAAEMTDTAMRAISDNWNTFGGDIGNIEHAFQGFAKQNYTMLDNLKIGYGGTKTEMERLIEDAEKVDENFKAQRDSSGKLVMGFADIVTAIDLIQQKQNIAGTTQREAASTISGSLGMVKAAWENLLVGMSDSEADIDSLLSYIVESVGVAFENILPMIEKALTSISTLIENITPMIVEKLPTLVETVLPPLLSAASSIVAGIIQALPSLIQVIIEQIPSIVVQLYNAIVATLPMFLTAGKSIITSLTKGMTPEELIRKGGELAQRLLDKLLGYLPKLLDSGIKYVEQIASGLMKNLPTLLVAVSNVLVNVISKLTHVMPEMLQKGADMVKNLTQGLTDNLPNILNATVNMLSRMITAILDEMPRFLERGVEILSELARGIGQNIPTIVSSIAKALARLTAEIAKHLPEFLQKGLELVGQIAAGIVRAIPDILKGAWDLITSFVDEFGKYDWKSIGSNIIDGIINGLWNMAGSLWDAIVGVVDNAWGGLLSWLGIASPSKKAEKEIGKNWAMGIGVGFDKNMPVDDMVDSVEGAFNEISGAIGPVDVPDFTESSTYTVETDGNTKKSGVFAPVFNIYGTDGQDINDLADIVMDRLTFLYQQEGAAYGIA